jgi:YcaO-like protein with predicted kinase domain
MMFDSGSPSSLHLRSIKKYATKDGNDITYMDRLYIPNYSIVLPGTEDSIWVYGGKGPTKMHARTSALMESIERYCSFPSVYSKRLIQGTYIQLSKIYNKVLHPDEVVEPVEQSYNDNGSIVNFVLGFDLLNNSEVLVPAELALYKFSAKPPSVSAFPYSHTNGLASGNVMEEAICHALCEVIERDAASIADLCASSIPYNILKKKSIYPIRKIIILMLSINSTKITLWMIQVFFLMSTFRKLCASLIPLDF